MKDNFSKQADLYAQYRPEYPSALYNFIMSNVQKFDKAWDCATGNGQVAKELSKHFDKVEATDISQKQLDNAQSAPNITYSISKAEKTEFSENSFDLITVGQAIHWFDFNSFFKEAKRILKPTGVLAVWGYSNMLVKPDIDNINLDFYQNITGPYCDPERKHIDNRYANIDFPFSSIIENTFYIEKRWDLKSIEGFFNTWSSVQHFIAQEDYNPVPAHIINLKKHWNEGEFKTVRFPVFLKVMFDE